MRRIKRIEKITLISLCPAGANRLPVVFKADGGVVFNPIVKADMEKGEITACVYAPEHRDSQGDIASAEVIKEAAYSFAKDGEGVDIRHNQQPLPREQVYVAESFIIQKGDPRFSDLKDRDGKPVDATEGWGVVLKVDDPDLRTKYRSGEWGGVSMFGTAVVEQEKESGDRFFDRLVATIKEAFHRNLNTGDIDMTKDELNEVLAASNAALVKSIGESFAEAVKPLAKSDDKPDDAPEPKEKTEPKKAPVFKGDFSKPEDVRKHRRALAIFKVEQEFDATDPEQFEKMAEAISEIDKEFADNDDDGDKPDDKPAGSRQPAKKEEKESERVDGLAKEDSELLAAGAKTARVLAGVKD
jgi:hypothetical protein